jgi:CheY-like chemotaxis protein
MDLKKPILLVEDDEVDIMTIRRALKDLKISHPLEVAHNGEEALKYFEDARRPKPWFILLDLNTPRMNGIEFLSQRKRISRIFSVPVVVLTSSKDEQDIEQCYRLGVSGYMLKPMEYDQFVETIHVIEQYWKLSQSLNTGQ